MMLQFLLPFLLASCATSMTVFPDIMSESEVDWYLQQAAPASGSLRTGKAVQVDRAVATRISTALGGKRLLEMANGSSVWEAPVTSYLRNPLKSGLKVSRRFID